MGILRNAIGAIQTTFSGQYVKDIAELVLVDGFNTPELTKYHTVRQNIIAREQIAFANPLYKISKLAANCDNVVQTKTINITEKFWTPVNIHTVFNECYVELEQSFFVYMLNLGKNRADLTNTDAITFIFDILRQGVIHDAQRIAWFGDTAITNVSVGGRLKNSESVTDYNHYNGFWHQLFEIGTANPNLVIAIPENSAVTKIGQQTLAVDRAYNTFQQMWENSDSRMDKEDAMILCTRRMFNNYMNTLRNRPNDMGSNIIINGLAVPAFDGVPVYNYDVWDRAILDFDNGTVFDRPNRALLTTKQNLQLGIDALSSIGDFMAGYDITNDNVVVRGRYKADAKVMIDFLTMMAY